MNIVEVKEIIEDFGYPEYVPHAEEILTLAEALKDGEYVVAEEIQESTEDFHRQCEDDKTIMRERARSERKRNSLSCENDGWDI